MEDIVLEHGLHYVKRKKSGTEVTDDEGIYYKCGRFDNNKYIGTLGDLKNIRQNRGSSDIYIKLGQVNSLRNSFQVKIGDVKSRRNSSQIGKSSTSFNTRNLKHNQSVGGKKSRRNQKCKKSRKNRRKSNCRR